MKKTKMGRPPMKPSERRVAVVNVVMTRAERARLEAEAKRSGQTLSEVLMLPWRREGE